MPQPEEDQQQNEGTSKSSDNAILDAIKLLSMRMDKLALKSDLDQMKADITKEKKTEMKVQVAAAVDPLKSELHDIKARVVSVENRPGSSMDGPSPQILKTVSKMQAALGRLDPNIRLPRSLDGLTA